MSVQFPQQIAAVVRIRGQTDLGEMTRPKLSVSARGFNASNYP